MVACIDFFEMSEIFRPKFIVRHSTYFIFSKKKKKKQTVAIPVALNNLQEKL
jgi:hypothetical protein